MRHAQRLLAAAVASIVGKGEERAVASLFSPGGTHALKGEFAGGSDFEVLAYLHRAGRAGDGNASVTGVGPQALPTAATVLAALGLPSAALVQQRVPRSF